MMNNAMVGKEIVFSMTEAVNKKVAPRMTEYKFSDLSYDFVL